MKFASRVDTGVSFGSSFVSKAFGLESLEGYSVVASWGTGGGPGGTLTLEGSNNAFVDTQTNLQEDPNAVWVTITGSQYVVTADGTFLWNVADVFYKAFRYRYVRTGGTATGTFYIDAKGFI